MQTEVINKTVPLEYLRQLAEGGLGNLVKAVVDVERRIIHPDLPGDERIEFDSMINIRPAQAIARAVSMIPPPETASSRLWKNWWANELGTTGAPPRTGRREMAFAAAHRTARKYRK